MNPSDPDSDPSPEPLESEDDNVTESGNTAFLPILLLGLSWAVFLVSVVSSASSQQSALEQAVEKNKPTLQQAAQLQNATSKLVSDLIEIAKDDDDAKVILYRANVRRPNGEPLVTLGNPSQTSNSNSVLSSGSSSK